MSKPVNTVAPGSSGHGVPIVKPDVTGKKGN
jgi:hypothetical protein